MDAKKRAAIATAVIAYIKGEEEAAVGAFVNRAKGMARKKPPVSVNLWGISGRQQQMQLRNLMQLRVCR